MRQEKQKRRPEQARMLIEQRGVPGSGVDPASLIKKDDDVNSGNWKDALVGQWQGTTVLYLEPPPAAGVTSDSRLTITPIAGGNFLQLNYDWSHEGAAQSGVLLIGYEEAETASAAWVDSFHMSAKIMSCTGSMTDDAATLNGSYAAPPGPDWGWRITVKLVAADELQIVMHNIWPDGKIDLAVQADYKRC